MGMEESMSQVNKSEQSFFTQIRDWAVNHSAIDAVLLVGSHARGEARPDSDIDLVFICTDPQQLLSDTGWVSRFGTVTSVDIEDWGMLQSVRVFFDDGLEVEFGMTTPEWAAVPLDEGTREVVTNGAKIICDKNGNLQKLLTAIQ